MKVIPKYILIIVLCSMTLSYLGCKKDKVFFDYLRPSVGDTTTLLGVAGAERADSAANSVYLDLSKNVQTTVLRSSWDLGFYCGADDFRVIINHSIGETAAQTTRTTMPDAATALTDSTTNGAAMVLDYTTGNANNVDLVSADSSTYLPGTVIKQIAVNDADNKVYIIKRGSNSTVINVLKKIGYKVLIKRATNGYTVTYGRIADEANNLRTVLITKNDSYNFKYLSLANGAVTVDPSKLLWDIEFGVSTYKNATTPVVRPDFVLTNFMGGVKAAQVMITSTKNYDNFLATDVSGVTFLGTRDAIGSNWFDGSSAASADGKSLVVYTDRFYLIKDAKGNVYALNFNGGGARGNPVIRYRNIIDNEPKNL